MWVWLWDLAVGRNWKNSVESVSERLRCLEETVSRGLMTFQEAASEGLRETGGNVFGN